MEFPAQSLSLLLTTLRGKSKGHNSPAPKPPHNPMHDRYILPLDIIDHNLPNLRLPRTIPEEEQISPLKGRFHATGEHDHDGWGGVAKNRNSLPQHESGREDEGEVEDLRRELPRLEVRERWDHGLWFLLVGRGDEWKSRYCGNYERKTIRGTCIRTPENVLRMYSMERLSFLIRDAVFFPTKGLSDWCTYQYGVRILHI